MGDDCFMWGGLESRYRTHLHDRGPEMHSLRSNLAVPELGEATSLRFGGGGGALKSSLGEACLLQAEVLAHSGAEAQAEAGGHVEGGDCVGEGRPAVLVDV